MNIPEMLVNLIDVFIVIQRFHIKEKLFRVIDEVSESSGMEEVKILLANVYKYDYDSNKIKTRNPSTVYRDRLAQQSGLTPKQIMAEHYFRAMLLEELDKRNIISTKEVTTFCRSYSRDPNGTAKSMGYDRERIINDKNVRR